FLTLLFYGQISHILLLGLTGFIFFSKREAHFRAGFSLSATLIKPHALYLLYFWILLEGMRTRSLKSLLGFAVGAAFLGIVPLVWQPGIWNMYSEFASSPPVSWITPTIGSWLQSWTIGDHQSQKALTVRLLPSAI